MKEEANEEYGLDGLATLPLLEQCHRLFHAISMSYPFKSTNAWKSLSMDQKAQMLKYIQQNKSTLIQIHANKSSESAEKITKEKKVQPKEDPYLNLRKIQNDKLKRHLSTSSCGSQPSTMVMKRTAQKKGAKKWQLVDERFSCCICGVSHLNEDLKSLSPILVVIKNMMKTFGDSDCPCTATAQEVMNQTKEYLNHGIHLSISNSDSNEDQSSTLTSSTVKDLTIDRLMQIYPVEVEHYLRWKDFKSKSSNNSNRGADDEDEEEHLADELEEFSAENKINEISHPRYRERLQFADERTTTMDYQHYKMFSSNRNASFLKKGGNDLLQWLQLDTNKISKAVIECLSFITYDRVGFIIESAIKKDDKEGKLNPRTKPLEAHHIGAAYDTFSFKQATRTIVADDSDAIEEQFTLHEEIQEETPPGRNPAMKPDLKRKTSENQPSPAARPARLKRLR